MKCPAGYKLTKSQEKVNNFAEDIKLFGNNKKELETVI